MFKQKYKYILLGFITIVFFSLINISIINFNLLYQSQKLRRITIEQQNFDSENLNLIQEKSSENIENKEWKIIIPKIELEANITEGTTQEVIAKTVGHFTETPVFEGNVGLAAHNSGIKNGFFKELKNLKIGDEIIYITQHGTKKYKVDVIKQIQETDWSYLKNMPQNKITLITCVRNMPHLRLCVQATQM